jgi:hypothetical protein
MRKLVSIFAAASLGLASAAAADPSCPKAGYTYPWMIEDLMAGDSYADVYIDIDRSGRPLSCKYGQTNFHGEELFWVCNAFMEQFRTKPPVDLAKGERTTVMRTMVDYGDAHRKAEKKAKKKYFAEHPDERASCYASAD